MYSSTTTISEPGFNVSIEVGILGNIVLLFICLVIISGLVRLIYYMWAGK